jgi:hypothetical protein
MKTEAFEALAGCSLSGTNAVDMLNLTVPAAWYTVGSPQPDPLRLGALMYVSVGLRIGLLTWGCRGILIVSHLLANDKG